MSTHLLYRDYQFTSQAINVPLSLPEGSDNHLFRFSELHFRPRIQFVNSLLGIVGDQLLQLINDVIYIIN